MNANGGEKNEIQKACIPGTGGIACSSTSPRRLELSGDTVTAFEIYYDTYDIHELPPLK